MENKTVREILSNRIVIPEIQREYVWGQNKDLVQNFLTDLNKSSSMNEDYHLGFLYSYEKEAESRLIDGQQRMTTIALLALYCSKNEKRDINVLPNFSYRVRTDTEEYLQGLFKADLTAKDFHEARLKNSKLYRSHYSVDVTIGAMISTLNIIADFAEKQAFHITFDWIMDHIWFWTFEVRQTSQGEELYISMNSRGEALTSSEMIKPRLLENADKNRMRSQYNRSWGKTWDDWEDLLFSSRPEGIQPESVNVAFDSFLNTIKEIITGKPSGNGVNASSDAEVLSLDKVEQFFEALKHILNTEDLKSETGNMYKGKECLVLKVLVALALSGEPEIPRVYKIIKNWERLGLLKNEGLLRTIHRFRCENPEKLRWLDFVIKEAYSKDAKDEQIEGVINHHEWLKIKLYQGQEDINYRDDLEKSFHDAEDNPNMLGYIRAVWDEPFEDSFIWKTECLDIFKARYKQFNEIFDDKYIKTPLSNKPENGRIDNNILTRALLSINDGYGLWVGGQNYTYGWKSPDGGTNYWQRIISGRNGAKTISELIDKLLSDKEHKSLYKKLEAIVSSAKGKYNMDNGLYYILNYPMALRAQIHGHNVISFDGIGIILIYGC